MPHAITDHWTAVTAVVVFIVAYVAVIFEEQLELNKSKPVMIAAGVIWILLAIAAHLGLLQHNVEDAARHTFLEYAELAFFLIVAMTYINAMEERNVFQRLRSWLVEKQFSFRALFWLTGALAFCISPVFDNLTTALLLNTVVMSVAAERPRFIALSAINIVIAANAGGAFSPFGDITTLMVWQKQIVTPQGTLDFFTFFRLFVPALVNWLVPALILNFAIRDGHPDVTSKRIYMKRGARGTILLFLLTVATAVIFHQILDLPPVLGMLFGLGLLKMYAYILAIAAHERDENSGEKHLGSPVAYDVFRQIARAEWDTIFFFYGVVMSVGGLAQFGYLHQLSSFMYGQWGPTPSNVTVGVLSSIIDNIPVMYAVLSMEPAMSLGQWLLVTLTAGVGGSLLSIGSAAGVALMGQARGKYTFFAHLRWLPAILLGYALSIIVHIWINAAVF
ncbi:MAG: sodium:proton antiporter [Candidatus Dadabacteria bacterium]|nr:MAG: sodium:proton antiporter [Candidatus Dadabacteria bacterium]